MVSVARRVGRVKRVPPSRAARRGKVRCGQKVGLAALGPPYQMPRPAQSFSGFVDQNRSDVGHQPSTTNQPPCPNPSITVTFSGNGSVTLRATAPNADAPTTVPGVVHRTQGGSLVSYQVGPQRVGWAE